MTKRHDNLFVYDDDDDDPVDLSRHAGTCPPTVRKNKSVIDLPCCEGVTLVSPSRQGRYRQRTDGQSDEPRHTA